MKNGCHGDLDNSKNKNNFRLLQRKVWKQKRNENSERLKYLHLSKKSDRFCNVNKKDDKKTLNRLQ